VPADEFDPERILRVFADHGVECLIVGGFGLQFYGAHRQTLDIHVIPHSTDANLERLATALRELGARLRVGGLTDDEACALPVTVDAATLRSFVSSTWMTDAGPIDVLGDLPVAGGDARTTRWSSGQSPDRSTASSSTSHRSTTSSPARNTPIGTRTDRRSRELRELLRRQGPPDKGPE
jgi:hypothetical protein